MKIPEFLPVELLYPSTVIIVVTLGYAANGIFRKKVRTSRAKWLEIHFDFVAFVISRDPSGCTSVQHVYSVLGKNVSACFVDFYRQCKWMTISQNMRNFHDKILVNTAFQLHEVFCCIK